MNHNILDQNLENESYKLSLNKRPIFIWLTFLVIGVLFKIIHWPGSSILIIVPSAGLQAYCINGIIFSKLRDILCVILCVFGIIWLLILLVGLIFYSGYPYNEIGLGVYGATLLVYFIIYYLLVMRNKIERTNK